METGIIMVGAIFLVASIFGYMYPHDNQDLSHQGTNIGETPELNLLKAVSRASIVASVVLIIAGIIPEEVETNRSPI
jgi:hypothetical protein